MKHWCLALICLLTAAGLSPAHGQSVTKEKKISGRFPADRGKLTIDNRYGKLDIQTWDRNEVTVEITVTAKAATADKAQALLDQVSITTPADKGGISYKTVLAPSTANNGAFRIDYLVHMPSRQPAAFYNKYGDIDLADVAGPVDVDLDYGKLKAGAMKGGGKELRVSYGSATIGSVETGRIQVAYSGLSVEKAGSLVLDAQSGTITLGAVRELEIVQKYGDLKIGSAGQLNGSVQYTGIAVNQLLKSAGLRLSYCTSVRFGHIGPEVTGISIQSGFSNLYFHFDPGAGLTANLSASFGRVSSEGGGLSLTESGGGPGQAATYKGRIGNGRGTMDLKVSYGNVVFK